MTIVMTALTIFALWGDNFRLAVFNKSADGAFFVLFTITFTFFISEFVINTISKADYKRSFFFYLDFVAAVIF